MYTFFYSDFQKKKNSIKALKRKALDRNPDEFYFNMVKTQKMVCKFLLIDLDNLNNLYIKQN